jgi:alkanesulfonate monooxygenase SsuD/methylene tetrahydromethanopterin reductase-like flavin-dependent oxidoreductase (luciferase family)
VSTGVDLSRHTTVEEVARARGAHGSHGLTESLGRAAAATGGSLVEAARRTTETQGLVGSPSTVADTLQEQFEAGGCDGFVIMPTTFPTSHEQFCRAVVPELQRRGLFRTEYAADTLRGNLLAS